MERECLDYQEAFTHLRRAARSSDRRLTEVAREVAAGKPLPRGPTRPTPNRTEQPNGEADTPQPGPDQVRWPTPPSHSPRQPVLRQDLLTDEEATVGANLLNSAPGSTSSRA
jgi:hypothetical protein